MKRFRLVLMLVLLFPLVHVPAFAQLTRTYVTFMGAWSPSVQYNLNEIVTYNGIFYISTSALNANQNPATATTKWQVFSGTVTQVSLAPSGGLTGTVTNPSVAPGISIGPDSSHMIPVTNGSASTFLNGAGQYVAPATGVSTVSVTPSTSGLTGSVTNPNTAPQIAITPDSGHMIPVTTGSPTTFLNGAGGYSAPSVNVVGQQFRVGTFTGAGSGSTAPLAASQMTTDATGAALAVPGPLNNSNVPTYASTVLPLSTTGGQGIITANYRQFQYVSVQNSSTIQIYDTSLGAVTSVGSYTTSCTNPGGIAFANAGTSVIGAYTCGTSLYPVTVNAMTGALSTIASSTVTIPQASWPGMISDGTNFYIPTGGNCPATSIVYKYSAATLSLVGQYQLANSSDGTQQCSAYMAYSGGNLYLVAGGEPTTSTIQVVNAATMTGVGTPFVVAHSPQRIVAQGTYLYVVYYDAAKIDIINASNPSALSIVSSISLPSASVTLAVQGTRLYVGLYASGGTIAAYDVSNPALPLFLQNLPTAVLSPQDLKLNGRWLMAVSNSTNGNLVAFDTGGAGINYLNASEINAPTITSSKISGTAGFFAGMTASNVNAGFVSAGSTHAGNLTTKLPLVNVFDPFFAVGCPNAGDPSGALDSIDRLR